MALDGRIGSEIAAYRIERFVGRGGMGVVYQAEDMRLGRRVALKLLSADLAEDDRFRDRFVRESRLAASLEHPNIVPIYAAGEADGQLYVAMRYVDGTDLRALIAAQGPLEPALAVELDLAGRKRAGRSPRQRARPPRRQGCERAAAIRGRPRVPLGLRPRETDQVGKRDDRHRTARRHRRLPGARADRGPCHRRPGGSVRTGVPAVRMSDGNAAVSAADRGGDVVGAHAGRAASAAGRLCRPRAPDPPRAREVALGSLPQLRGLRRRCPLAAAGARRHDTERVRRPV